MIFGTLPVVQSGSVRPEQPWPPARSVRRVLAAARSRYHRLRLPWRPSLRDPRSYVGLFPVSDLPTLALASCWPLPPRALAWLEESPPQRARRQRRLDRRIAAVVRDLLTAELPAAVAYLRGRESQ
jgi:hypothetical protein